MMLGWPNRVGFHTVTPYQLVLDPARVVGFLESAFGAEVTYRTTGGGGGEHIGGRGGAVPRLHSGR
jgi:uncharacterized glyoxalase superfamily protein PhnB